MRRVYSVVLELEEFEGTSAGGLELFGDLFGDHAARCAAVGFESGYRFVRADLLCVCDPAGGIWNHRAPDGRCEGLSSPLIRAQGLERFGVVS